MYTGAKSKVLITQASFRLPHQDIISTLCHLVHTKILGKKLDPCLLIRTPFNHNHTSCLPLHIINIYSYTHASFRTVSLCILLLLFHTHSPISRTTYCRNKYTDRHLHLHLEVTITHLHHALTHAHVNLHISIRILIHINIGLSVIKQLHA